jgi:PAS domain S-box-containing protein
VSAAEDDFQSIKRRYELVLQSSSDGIFGVDDEGRVTFVNPAGARLLGYAPSELIGHDYFTKFHDRRPDGTPMAREDSAILAGVRDGTAHHVRGGEAFWKKDGTPLAVEFVSTPVRSPSARHYDALVLFRPEEKPGAKRGQLDAFGLDARQVLALYERTTDAFFALDHDWKIVYLNPVALAMVPPQNRARRVGERLWDAFPDLKGTRFDVEYHRAMEHQVNVHVEEYFTRMGRWFSADAFPTPDGISIYFRDITARKKAEESQQGERIARPLVRQVVQDLVEAGSVAHQALQAVGRKLALDHPQKDLDAYARAYHEMGLGELKIEKNEEGRVSFSGTDLLEKRPGSRVATCFFTLGYVSEAVSRVSNGEPTLGTEIECQSRGSHECRFIVQVRKAEEGLARRVKELV